MPSTTQLQEPESAHLLSAGTDSTETHSLRNMVIYTAHVSPGSSTGRASVDLETGPPRPHESQTEPRIDDNTGIGASLVRAMEKIPWSLKFLAAFAIVHLLAGMFDLALDDILSSPPADWTKDDTINVAGVQPIVFYIAWHATIAMFFPLLCLVIYSCQPVGRARSGKLASTLHNGICTSVMLVVAVGFVIIVVTGIRISEKAALGDE